MYFDSSIMRASKTQAVFVPLGVKNEKSNIYS